MARALHDHADLLNCDCEEPERHVITHYRYPRGGAVMGHAPPRPRPVLLARQSRAREHAERARRRRDALGQLPAGAVLVAGVGLVWLSVLAAGFIVGSPLVALTQLALTLVLVAVTGLLHRRKVYLARPEGAEAWFRREVGKQSRDEDVMAWLPDLELEYDYRLGLKQRPESVVAPPEQTRLVPVGGMVRPTQPPPKPADAARVLPTYRPPDAEMLEAARAVLRKWPGSPGKAWRSEHVHMVAVILGRVRDRSLPHAYLLLYDHAPKLHERKTGTPFEVSVCRCGHFSDAHTAFDRPQLVGESERDGRKCVRTCSCEGYVPVPVIPLSSHGEPSPANAQAYAPLGLAESSE